RLWLPRPRPEVFDFFADPRNLPRVAPAWAAPVWLVDPPARLAAGDVLDFRTRGPVPARWRGMIPAVDPPHPLVGGPARRPLARWGHRRRFLEGGPEPDGAGPPGTWVEDRVTYRLPFGPLGRAAHALLMGRRIAAALDFRERRLRETFP